MESVSDLELTLWASAFKATVVLPALAIFFEDGGDRIDRKEFAFWLAGFLVAWLVIVLTIASWLTSTLALHWLTLLTFPMLVFLVPFVLILYHFHESVAQRTRDAGLWKAVAYFAAVPPLNAVLFVILLLLPTAAWRRTRRRRFWRWRWRRRRRGPGWPSRVSAWLPRPAWNALAGPSRPDGGAPVPSKPDLLYGPPPEGRWISSFPKNSSSSAMPPGRSPRASSRRGRQRGTRTRSFRRRRFAPRRR